MKKLVAMTVGLVVFGVVLWLTWPLGCFDSDSGPGGVRQPGECPKSLTHLGFEWWNIQSGLVGAILLSVVAASIAGVYSLRRLERAQSSYGTRP